MAVGWAAAAAPLLSDRSRQLDGRPAAALPLRWGVVLRATPRMLPCTNPAVCTSLPSCEITKAQRKQGVGTTSVQLYCLLCVVTAVASCTVVAATGAAAAAWFQCVHPCAALQRVRCCGTKD